MCGIIAVAGNKIKEIQDDVMRDMLVTLSKRGPDDHGFVRFSKCLLGQTRLSIIDLAGGHQPMRDNTKLLTIAFNGEIYNYQELKKELLAKGHRFSTDSDTEVILKTYIEYGENCPKYLDGMFAFLIWNEETKELFIARDRFGKKPLFYAFDNKNNIVCASEIKAILKSNLIKAQVDFSAIDDYLRLLYIPPWKSVYKNIVPLLPAHHALFKNGKLEVKRYWHMAHRPITISREDAKKKIKKLFENAVRKRLFASDVEVGTFLSGGVDSSMVSYMAQKELGTNKKLKTFSIGFEDQINELPYAEAVSNMIESEQHSFNLKENILDYLKIITTYFDEPFADSSMIPQYLVSQNAHKKVKVVLSGDGADELFLGYGWQFKQWQLGFVARIRQKMFSSPFKDYLKYTEYFSTTERKHLWKDKKNVQVNTPQFPPTENRNLKAIDKINMLDISLYLPGDILTKVDLCGMMNSLEVRSPFLDIDLAEFVYNIPIEYKYNDKHGGGKSILKEIFGEFFGEKLANRRKQGFGAPVHHWLKKEDVRNFVYEKIGEKSSAGIFDFLDEKYIQKLISQFYEKNDKNYAYKIWVLICLELWLQQHKKYFI